MQGHSESPSHSEASHLDRGEALCSFEGAAEILRERFSYGRRPDSRAIRVSPAALRLLGGGWQAALRVRFTKPRSFATRIPLSRYRSRLTRRGSASLMPLTRTSGIMHNITRPEALAAQARAASSFPAHWQVAAKRPSAATNRAASSTSRAARRGASATCKPASRRNLKPTKPTIQISDADRKRKIMILITDNLKCTMVLKKWREKGASFRVDRYRFIEGRCLHQIMSAKTKVTKTKTAIKPQGKAISTAQTAGVRVF